MTQHKITSFSSLRCNFRIILLRLHGVPNPRGMVSITSGWSSSVWSCCHDRLIVYFVNSHGNALEPSCIDCIKNIRGPRVGELKIIIMMTLITIEVKKSEISTSILNDAVEKNHFFLEIVLGFDIKADSD